MYKYVIKRILLLIPTIIGVSMLIFFMMDAAEGDITDVIGVDYSEEALQQLREELNLDKPTIYRYFLYMKDLVRGDMGYSYVLKQDISFLYKQRFPNTIKLSLASLILCTALSIPLGILAALKHGTLTDNACNILSILGLSIPNFWLGLLLIMLFALKLHWLPSFGADEGIKSILMPAFTLGTGMMATMARTTRSSMLDVLQADYLRTARAKGVRENTVVTKHALRNALIPIITIFGNQLGSTLGGAVVTENVFTWPGIGQLLVSGIKNRDTTLVCGLLIMAVIVICIVQLLVDLVYAFVDPRLKGRYASSKKSKPAAKEGAKA